MTFGPVQLIAIGFLHPNFHGEIIAELEHLRESETVRIIDALAVYKNASGDVEVEHLSTLSQAEAVAAGSTIGALLRFGLDEDESDEAITPADEAEGVSDEEVWDVLEDIPNDSAAALVLLEHRWAVPIRDALIRAGGFRISDGFINPLDLVDLGLATAEEAQQSERFDPSGG